MKSFIALSLFTFAAFALASCGSVSENDPRYKAMRQKECAIYFTVDAYLQETGQKPAKPIASGCPRHLLGIADMSPIEPPQSLEDATAKALYAELIARGTPQKTAQDVARSKGFKDWVEATKAAKSRL